MCTTRPLCVHAHCSVSLWEKHEWKQIVCWHIINASFYVIMWRLLRAPRSQRRTIACGLQPKRRACPHSSASCFTSTCSQQSWIPARACIFSSCLWDSSSSIWNSLSITACVCVFSAYKSRSGCFYKEDDCEPVSRMYIMGVQAHRGGSCKDLSDTLLAGWVLGGDFWPKGTLAGAMRVEILSVFTIRHFGMALPSFLFDFFASEWTDWPCRANNYAHDRKSITFSFCKKNTIIH